MPKSTPPSDCCGNCEYFAPPKALPSDKKAAATVQAGDVRKVYSTGMCRRFPATVQKTPDDYCGEFQQERF